MKTEIQNKKTKDYHQDHKPTDKNLSNFYESFCIQKHLDTYTKGQTRT